ncbi:Glycosyltransferase Family 90 domain containing protein [Tulasnella sp. JGI-2019a]|nr:Glycosyltransferase Family 90 domain containing protein [Tulasnella sp. JGI-2019a]
MIGRFINHYLFRLRRLRRLRFLIAVIVLFLLISYTGQEYDLQASSTSDAPSTHARSSTGFGGLKARLSRRGSPSHRSSPGHSYASNGLLRVNSAGAHPILGLVHTANKQWQDKLGRSSKTLREAVVEYKRRYHRMPPKGFDRWWHYIVENNVQLPDEYDRINHDLSPFWGIKPGTLQELQHTLQQHDDTFTLSVEDHWASVSAQGEFTEGMEESAKLRAEAQLDILTAVEQWLPDFNATFSIHDGPQQFIDHELRALLVEKGMGEEDYVQEEEESDGRHLGWAAACPPFSPLRHQDPYQPLNISDIWNQRPESFIYNHKLTMDPCRHPSHVHLNGLLRNYGIGPMPSPALQPSFTMCTSPLHADILTVANEGWVKDVENDPDWDDKPDERLVWRGRTTGGRSDEHSRWELSQRVRLVELTNRDHGEVDVLTSPSGSEHTHRSNQSLDLKWANENFMDIGFVGQAIHCSEEICEIMERDLAFKPLMTDHEIFQYKYIMDIDGNGWSARFKRLMTTRSLILKSTIFPEWYTDRIQPWVHYVPVKNDLTDLYDIMTFFRGNRDGSGSHNELARQIAMEGRQWSLSFWRQEDMITYMFRLYLEYARVMSKDRESQTFTWDDLLAVEAVEARGDRRTGARRQ